MIEIIDVVCGPSKLKIGNEIASRSIAIRYRKKSGIAYVTNAPVVRMPSPSVFRRIAW